MEAKMGQMENTVLGEDDRPDILRDKYICELSGAAGISEGGELFQTG